MPFSMRYAVGFSWFNSNGLGVSETNERQK